MAIKGSHKTHCPQGHEYAGDNIYLWKGRRICHSCKTLRSWRSVYVNPLRALHGVSPEKRFLLQYEVMPSGCWQWTGSVAMPQGYGCISVDRKAEYAHRFSFRLHNGPIPEGLDIDHLCRNRLCVNPEHLEAVTTRENVLRGIGPSAREARQTQCKNGHPFAGDNLIIQRNGRRTCRICRNLYQNNRYHERRRSVLSSLPMQN
jgi:hypothetical protein